MACIIEPQKSSWHNAQGALGNMKKDTEAYMACIIKPQKSTCLAHVTMRRGAQGNRLKTLTLSSTGTLEELHKRLAV